MSIGFHALNVLAITSQNNFLREIRLEAILSYLKAARLIEHYFISDEYCVGLPDFYSCDVIWLQRVESIDLVRHISRCTHNTYIYDIDDLLIGRPTYTKDMPGDSQGAIDAVVHCSTLTAPSLRLMCLLERYLGISLAQKTVVCPNGIEMEVQRRPPAAPSGIVWSSSDYPALTDSREGVVRAVGEFSLKHRLPVYCIGHFDGSLKKRLAHAVWPGFLPLQQYRGLLGSDHVFIGIAPLETEGSREDLDFINAKSDIKMLDFGGRGHPGVYSAAPPYMDTDLSTGVLTANDEASWREALRIAHSHAWRRIHEEQDRIIDLRRMDRLASTVWMEALQRSRLDIPIPAGDLRPASTLSRHVSRGLSSLYWGSGFVQRAVALLPRPILRRLRHRLLGK